MLQIWARCYSGTTLCFVALIVLLLVTPFVGIKLKNLLTRHDCSLLLCFAGCALVASYVEPRN